MTNQRKYKRFAVTGKAVFKTPAGYLAAEIVDIAAGGILLRSAAAFPVGHQLTIQFTVDGFSVPLATEGQVVRAEPGFLGVKFVREVPGLLKLLFWLESSAVASPA